jgi:hypothetical protein
MRVDRWCSAILLVLALACSRDEAPRDTPSGGTDAPGARIELRVDDDLLAGDDAFAVIEPVYWSANIYGSLDEYESSLGAFSRPQRLLLALHWYVAEVNNGGHEQFYANSTGIVWPDALAALEAIDVPEGAAILRESAQRLGGDPARERDDRGRQLEERSPAFDDLDDRFYALQEEVDLAAKMLEYARSHASDFHFSGHVTRPAP